VAVANRDLEVRCGRRVQCHMPYPSIRCDHSLIHCQKVDTHCYEGFIMDQDAVVYRTGEVKV